MSPIDKLYKKDNYTIQKSINIEDRLYTELKHFTNENYKATISDAVNICIEDLIISKNDIKYYPKPYGEISIYRSFMLRRENIKELEKIKNQTGISITRLINIAIKNFLDKY